MTNSGYHWTGCKRSRRKPGEALAITGAMTNAGYHWLQEKPGKAGQSQGYHWLSVVAELGKRSREKPGKAMTIAGCKGNRGLDERETEMNLGYREKRWLRGKAGYSWLQ